MKILIVADTMAIGGTEKLTALLADRFATVGNDCMIMVLRDDLSALKFLNSGLVKIDHVFHKYRLDFFYMRKVRKVVKQFQPDVILCQALFSYISVKTALAFQKKAPIFLALHYTDNYCLKDSLFAYVYFLILWFNSDKIISIYRRQSDFFSIKYHIPIERFVLIHNGIQTDLFPIRRRQGGKKDRLCIVHVGNIKEEKDQLTLLRAMKLLESNHIDWELTFCGRDYIGKKHEFLEYLQSNGIEEKVIFIDFVEDVRTILMNADVFVLSSTSEALPVSVLEAMAMGVPCVLTNVGGCSDIVDDGENGFLVSPKDAVAIADKLNYLVTHRDVLAKMGIKAREKIEKLFRIEQMINGYLELFRRGGA